MSNDAEARQLRELLHALNQPLSAIGNYAQAGCQLIDAGRDDSAKLREIFAKIAAQSQRGVDLSRQLREALPREAGGGGKDLKQGAAGKGHPPAAPER